MLDQQRVREDTPGCLDKVFLDSAGSSLPPRPVVDAVVSHLRREAEVGGYRAAAERADDLAEVKASIAELLGARPEDIALVESATRAWADFFYAVPLSPGDRILITEVEYASNAIAALQRARTAGAHVEVVPSTPTGELDLEALHKMLDERVRVVSLVHAPTNGGLLNPVREVVDLAHGVGALVLLDACQSLGQVPLDVVELGVDALSATGRKWLRGPRGTGLLYLRPELARTMEPAALDLHGAQWAEESGYRLAPDASRFEFWECSVASRLGLGVAVRYLLDLGIDEIEQAVSARAEYARTELSTLSGVTVRDLGGQRSGIVSFTVDGVDPNVVRKSLADKDVTVTVSGRGSTFVDMSKRNLDGVVRASPHYFNTFEDIDRLVAAVAER
ncbi:aminotransferase class V-fold PLP-dependent enzyme [Rhodococcus spelaei]|uniref:Probable hercynylcysteine sulfoxide lyase n=1 Tax=Rhodococcus spelaei TaxID=2546320 RepID=A0A541BNR6_9NOCA|nr:aminotransferase class V-fold PLP-dependent enzyme [Rhodococcus spelaei]TQF73973.1 aminotransferase class V-fold PLP-dependent enzyme [Rhodococcus spelaei]